MRCRETGPLPPDVIERLAQKIEAETGLSFPAARRRDLLAALQRIAESMGCADEAACAARLLAVPWDKPTADICAFHLTIGETYFFREPRAFALACDYARRKMKEVGGAPRSLRIWSAGCCTGEEPYSIAMSLRQALRAVDPRAMSILATDLNPRHLQFAEEGVYRQWSFRGTDPTLQQRHFSELGDGRFRINDDIRQCVRFKELNLAAPAYPSVETGAMDIIFCRNVLMYFSRGQAIKAIERFRDCLVDGGWLIVSPGEASADLFAGFARVGYPDGIYFQKVGAHAQGELPQPVATIAVPDVDKPARKPSRQARQHRAPQDRRHVPVNAQNAADTFLSRARALANAGDVAQAMRILEQRMELALPTAELYHAKAQIALESGDAHGALRSLKGAIYLQPDFILARYQMGVLQAARNKHSEAARQFNVAVELLAAMNDNDIVPGSDGLHAAYLMQSARSYLERGGA